MSFSSQLLLGLYQNEAISFTASLCAAYTLSRIDGQVSSRYCDRRAEILENMRNWNDL